MAAPNKPTSGGPAKQSTTTGKPTNAPARPQNKPSVTPAKPGNKTSK